MVGSKRTSSCATPMAFRARSMAASSFSASSPAAPKAAPDTASSTPARLRPGASAEARKASIALITEAGRLAPLV